jgi:hypothetical protein
MWVVLSTYSSLASSAGGGIGSLGGTHLGRHAGTKFSVVARSWQDSVMQKYSLRNLSLTGVSARQLLTGLVVRKMRDWL